MTDTIPLHGILAEFDTADELVEAAKKTRAAGYRRIDAYSPHPVEELFEALELPPSRVPMVFFIAGLCGALGGFFMQYYASVISYPMNIAGRPLNSWPLFVAVTFELTILSAAIIGVVYMFARNGLPQPYHPVFNVPAFDRASQDGFFLVIESTDEQFDRAETTAFLQTLNPKAVMEAPE